MADYASEMRLYDPVSHERLYLDAHERELFLREANQLDDKADRLLCHVLHWTGCRIREALELVPQRIDIDARVITLRTIKKRKTVSRGKDAGKLKSPVFRQISIPAELAELLDLVFHIRTAHRTKKGFNDFLWPHSKNTGEHMVRQRAMRMVDRVMHDAGITGKCASSKGLRHGYGVAMTMAGMDIYELQVKLGHESAATTAIYRQILGQEAQQRQREYWDNANAGWKNG